MRGNIKEVTKTLLPKFGPADHHNWKKHEGQILLDHNLISLDDLQRVQAIAKGNGVSLEALLDGGFLSESALTSFLTLKLNLPVMDITHVPSQPLAMKYLEPPALL